MALSDEKSPVSTDIELSSYLSRMFNSVRQELSTKDQVQTYTSIPTKTNVGKLYYFNNAIGGDPVITAEGLYLLKSTGWVFVA